MRSKKPVRLPMAEVRTRIATGRAAIATSSQIPGLETLTASRRQRANRVRRGGEKMIRQMMFIARSRPELVPGAVDVDGMEEAFEFLALVRAMQTEATSLKTTMDDTVLTTFGDLWSDALDIYAALSRQARSDGEVTLALQEMKVFLARNKGKAAGEVGVPRPKPPQQDPGLD
jgi:hypothetical protein